MESFTQLSLRGQWKWQKKGLGIHQNSLSRAVKSLPLMEPRGKGKPQRSKSREAKGPEAQREEALTVRIQGWEPNRQGRKEGRDTEVDGRGPGRDARRGQATGTLTETGRESSNPTKISPPPPRRPGQCPHFREARLLTANGTSRSWQRRMRQTGDAQNLIVTCTELAACAESRRSLRLRDRERWLYGQDLISQAPDLLLTQEISPGLQRAMSWMFSGSHLLPFFWFSHEIRVLKSWLPCSCHPRRWGSVHAWRFTDLYWRG